MTEKTLEERVKEIEERDKRVEADKAWEKNPIRIGLIIVLTYAFAVGYLWVADTTNPFLGAIVPCLVFLLSTLSLKFIRSLWIKKRNKKDNK